MRVRVIPLWLAVCVVFVLGAPALAQDDIPFVDVPLEEAFVVTLPENWPVWVQSEYDNFDAADAAAVDLFNRIYPDTGLTTPFITPETKLLATLPTAPADGLVRFGVEMLSLSDFAEQTGVTPEFVSAEALAQGQAEALGGQLATTTLLNGRQAAFGLSPFNGQPLFSAITVFPEADRIAVISLTGPDSFFETEEALVTFMLSTLRLDGEPIPGAAFLALTGEELPDHWTLPDEIVYVEATPEQATPEPIVCELNATQSVNLRAGAGTHFPVMGSLAANSSASAMSQTEDAAGFIWFRVESGAWVRADVVVEDDTCADLPFVDAE